VLGSSKDVRQDVLAAMILSPAVILIRWGLLIVFPAIASLAIRELRLAEEKPRPRPGLKVSVRSLGMSLDGRELTEPASLIFTGR
jgi:hypothetical protein